jgi:tRNA(Arg) A34 adenosine deaminase TadA
MSVTLLGMTLALGLGIGLGYRAALGRDQDSASPGNHAVSDKVWQTPDQIRGRFPQAKHEEFMRRAIANSRKAGIEKRTGGAFGSVIVDRQGQIIADGSNQVVANNDPTWHGEMDAIRVAAARLKTNKLDGCILYTSSEPCPMCLATAYWAGLDGIYYGAFATDSKKYGGFDDVYIYEEFAKPVAKRNIPELQILRNDAVTVWKEYAALSDNVPY